MIKNFPVSTVLDFADQVSYQEGQVVSKTLAQDKNHSLTVFAFDKGEEISSHASDGDALVIALDGLLEVTIDEQKYMLKSGESILMPAHRPHAVFAPERCKMFLVVIF
ncbi:MAG: cupin domain-containing protein [Spirochaetia bacterium]|nr:cupin domain-containing protein [Sphaerochaeta sp.]NCC66160.1 cupin domain-containing protein [Spirochaetia bacterium]